MTYYMFNMYVKVARKCSVPPLDHLARYFGMDTFCATHPNLTYIQTIHTWPLIYVCRTTFINRTRLPVGGGSFNIVWWGYKYMFTLDGGSKIHSS